jgi:hypothetical protein
VWKKPAEGPWLARRLNIDGDGQGDLAGHGREHRAVFVYQINSYRYWQAQLGRDDFTYGQFGENFTVDGLADDRVCIGDRYRIGAVVFEVTQPRVTCYRVGIRLDDPQIPALLISHHRPGVYLRVLREGAVQAGGRDRAGGRGARNRAEEPFAAESRSLLARLASGHQHICFSRPAPDEVEGRDCQTEGRISAPVLAALNLPCDAQA